MNPNQWMNQHDLRMRIQAKLHPLSDYPDSFAALFNVFAGKRPNGNAVRPV